MPRIIDYPIVLERLTAEGLQCNYPNGGAFGFSTDAGAIVRGWIGPPDGTIKPAARLLARNVAEPYPGKLAESATLAWERLLPGNVWVMPGSHWSYELKDGSRDWMPALLAQMGLDSSQLAGRNNAAAIEFSPSEGEQFRRFIERTLEMLRTSDFFLAFPGRGTICLVHHHQQLWWITVEARVSEGLDALLS